MAEFTPEVVCFGIARFCEYVPTFCITALHSCLECFKNHAPSMNSAQGAVFLTLSISEYISKMVLAVTSSKDL